MREPDTIDQMDERELRTELRAVLVDLGRMAERETETLNRCISLERDIETAQSRLDACQSGREWLQKQNTIEQDHSASLKRSLAVAYSILNDAMAEQDYHVDVSRTAVWLASNEGVVEKL